MEEFVEAWQTTDLFDSVGLTEQMLASTKETITAMNAIIKGQPEMYRLNLVNPPGTLSVNDMNMLGVSETCKDPNEDQLFRQFSTLLGSSEMRELQKSTMQELVDFLEQSAGAETFQNVISRLLAHVKHTALISTFDAVNKKILQLCTALLDGCKDESQKLENLQQKLVDLGIINVLFTVIAGCEVTETELLKVTLKLATKFCKRGAISKVQTLVYQYFENKNETLFFEVVGRSIYHHTQLLKARVRYLKTIDDDDDVAVLDKFAQSTWDVLRRVIKLLQNLCEGQNLVMQEYLQKQIHSYTNVPLVSFLVDLLSVISEVSIDESLFPVTVQVLATITESLQGPCARNQVALSRTSLVPVCNTLLSRHSRLSQIQKQKLAVGVFSVIAAMLERRSDTTIQSLVATAIDADAITDNLINAFEAEGTAEYQQELDTQVAMFYSLLVNLRSFSSTFERLYQVVVKNRPVGTGEDKKHSENMVKLARHATKRNMAHIEIMWDGQLEHVIFPVPAMAKYFTSDMQRYHFKNLDFTSSDTKLLSFVDCCDPAFEELQLHAFLGQKKVLRYVLVNSNRILIAMFWLAIAINIYVSTTLYVDTSVSVTVGEPRRAKWARWTSHELEKILFITAVSFSFVIGFTMCGITYATAGMLRVKLYVKKYPIPKSKFRRFTRFLTATFLLVSEPLSLWYLVYASLAAVGLFSGQSDPTTKVVYPFLLLDVVPRSQTLQNVVSAFVRPARQLIYTFFFVAVIINIFAIFSFSFFGENYSNQECDAMWTCFLSLVDQALRAGGGVGEAYPDSATFNQLHLKLNNIVFNLCFFILVTIVLLNVVFGVIVDTFSALREESNQKRNHLKGFCFICGMSAEEIEKNSKRSFQYHNQNVHKMWDYLFFYIYLHQKPASELNGCEQYVMQSIKDRQSSWFPVPSNDKIEHSTGDHEDGLNSFQERVLDAVGHLSSKALAEKEKVPLAERVHTHDARLVAADVLQTEVQAELATPPFVSED